MTPKTSSLMPRNAILNKARTNPLSRRRSAKQAAFETRSEPKMEQIPRRFARTASKRPITLATVPFDWNE